VKKGSTKKGDVKTIMFTLFKRRLTLEIRNYWYCRTSFEYADRWWREDDRHSKHKLVTKYPGDDNQLFGSIDVSPDDYLRAKEDVLWSVRGNAITNIVTAFETYLYYQLKRAIYIKPEIIEKSGIEFTAGELASSFSSKDQLEWMADEVVKKYIRNNSHNKMIEKIDKLIKGGIANGQKALIERWLKKVTLRNALIHNSKLVNEELIKVWPQKFSQASVPISLEDGDVVRTHFVAYELAGKIDEQFQRAIIGSEDGRLLARVVYLMDRTRTNGQVADIVHKILNSGFSKSNAESAVAYQNKTRAYIPDFILMEEIVKDYLSSIGSNGSSGSSPKEAKPAKPRRRKAGAKGSSQPEAVPAELAGAKGMSEEASR
jgi:hypothetical protein